MIADVRPIRGVLFDLDGTLVDNMPFHIEAWIATARALGHTLTAQRIMRDFAGRRNEEILPQIVGRPVPAEELARVAAEKEQRYRELFTPHLALIAGAEAFFGLLAARGIAYGIASAAPRANRDFVMDGLGLRARMHGVVGGEEVARGKPAPDLFIEGARRIGVPPAEVLVFEDAQLGVEAGRAAGMRVCGITTGEPAEALRAAGAFATCASYTELPGEVLALLAPRAG
jgi:beta-phosphoglucomutase